MKIVKGTVLGLLAVLLMVACQPASLEILEAGDTAGDLTGTLRISIPNVAPWVVTDKDASDDGGTFSPKAFIYTDEVQIYLYDQYYNYVADTVVYPDTFGEGSEVWITEWAVPAGSGFILEVGAFNSYSNDYSLGNPSTVGYLEGIDIMPASMESTSVTVVMSPYNPIWVDQGIPITESEPLNGERWFYMEATASQMTVELFNETADLDLYVFDEMGYLIDLSYTAGAGEIDTVSFNTIPGHYYFAAVYAYEGGQYQIMYGSSIPTELYHDVESGADGWTTQTLEGTVDNLWHITDFTYGGSPTHSWYLGDEAIMSYDTGRRISNALVSPQINLVGTTGAWIQFIEYFDTEPGDDCIVEITNDGGVSWNPVRPFASGYSGGWIETGFDISAYLGQVVQVRFLFDTGDAINNSYVGWFIDDIQIYGY